MVRPRKFASDAERQAAYRDRYAVVSIRLRKETADTIDELAGELDVPRTEVINSLIIFALLNYNWKTLGLFGKRLPRAENPAKRGAVEFQAGDVARFDGKSADNTVIGFFDVEILDPHVNAADQQPGDPDHDIYGRRHIRIMRVMRLGKRPHEFLAHSFTIHSKASV